MTRKEDEFAACAAELERLANLYGAAMHELATAERDARTRCSTDAQVERDPAVVAAQAVRRETVSAFLQFVAASPLDIFGRVKQPGTGIYGERTIASLTGEQ